MQLPAAISNKLRRWSFYAFGCYRGTGGRLKYIAEDWSEVRLELPLSWRTRNYVGTIFGGSIYCAVDPIYMLMLIHRLGAEFTVWDKAAKIQFQKPGRDTLHGRLVVGDDELAAIRTVLASLSYVVRTYTVDLIDSSGTACASVEKIVYIRRR